MVDLIKTQWESAYANAKVWKACKDTVTREVIEKIFETPGFLGHKAVTNLHAQGHQHVGNDNAVAFDWKNRINLGIVGYGTKASGKIELGNSGYGWVV